MLAAVDMAAIGTSATGRVFGTTELLEKILLYTVSTDLEYNKTPCWILNRDLKTTLLSQRTSKAFRDTVLGSSKLQERLFLSGMSVASRAQRSPSERNQLLDDRCFSIKRRGREIFIDTHHFTYRHLGLTLGKSSDDNGAAREEHRNESWWAMLLARGAEPVSMELYDSDDKSARPEIRSHDAGMTVGEIIDRVLEELARDSGENRSQA